MRTSLLLGDFNLSTGNPNFKNLLNSSDLESLIRIPTCYKSLLSSTCIDLILTNKKIPFMKFTTFETRISSFHKLTQRFYEKQVKETQRYSSETIKLLTITLLIRDFNQN